MDPTPATNAPPAITLPPESQGGGGFDPDAYDETSNSGFAAAFAAHHGLPAEGEGEAATTEQPPAETAPAADTQPQEGETQPAEGAEGTEAQTAAGTQPEAEVKLPEAAQFWSDEDKEKYKALDENGREMMLKGSDAQMAIHARQEAAYRAKMREAEGLAGTAEQFKEVLGDNPAQQIHDLLSADQHFRQDPTSYLRQAAELAGVSPTDVFPELADASAAQTAGEGGDEPDKTVFGIEEQDADQAGVDDGMGLEFSDYIVYVDESGDHGLGSIDPGYPVFVLAFCIFQKSEYPEEVAPRIQQFKFRRFGHDIVILHEADIRKDQGDFRFLKDPDLKHVFMEDLTEIIKSSPFTLICVVIDKGKLRENYRFPDNPYHLALKYGLERVFDFLKKRDQGRRLTHIVMESRGKEEDRELELEFLRVVSGKNYRGDRFPFEFVSANKKCNSAGLQLADLCARPVGRWVLKPDQENRAFEVLKEKFDRDPSGEFRGRGLKIFPE